MSLWSGRKIHAYEWEELPIDEEIIDKVKELALKEKQPKLVDGLPIFEWNSKYIMEDNINDSDVSNQDRAMEDEIVDLDDIEEYGEDQE